MTCGWRAGTLLSSLSVQGSRVSLRLGTLGSPLSLLRNAKLCVGKAAYLFQVEMVAFSRRHVCLCAGVTQSFCITKATYDPWFFSKDYLPT